MGNAYSQSVPPAPVFTEKNLPSQKGKVFIVTGGASGVGLELCKLLFGAGATVYMAGRSETKATEAIASISKWVTPNASISPSTNTGGVAAESGALHFLQLDLANLASIKASALEFLAREERLDVLWNNAGVMDPPAGSVTEQDIELQLGTNCVGPYLFTHFLLPILRKSAAAASLDGAEKGSVRVVWTSSILADLTAPHFGMDLDNLRYADGGPSQSVKYAQSKVGNIFLGVAFAQRLQDDGVLSVCANPGNLRTALTRHNHNLLQNAYKAIQYEPIYGAYTELFAGLSQDLTMKDSGGYIIPWGRISRPRNDIVQAMLPYKQGGKNASEKFFKWCENETAAFL